MKKWVILKKTVPKMGFYFYMKVKSESSQYNAVRQTLYSVQNGLNVYHHSWVVVNGACMFLSFPKIISLPHL